MKRKPKRHPALKPRKKPGRHKAGTVTIRAKGHNPEEATGVTGHEERLQALVKRAVELKRLDYFHHQIARMIADEFQLESIPSIPTIARWLQKTYGEQGEEINAMQMQMRQEQFKRLEELLAKYLPLANADHLEVTRWKMEEGSLQPSLDENAVAEQIDAANLCVKIMARQAKLLGIDLDNLKDGNKGDGPETLQELQIWIINQVSGAPQPNGAAIDVQSEVLELRSGIPEEEDAV